MARAGRKIRLPLLNRVMPLICDEWAKPQLGSGCVKITPAHDPNDYAVWTRHQQEIDSINILNEDGTLNANAGPYAGLDRFIARQRVVEDLRTQDLLEAMEERARSRPFRSFEDAHRAVSLQAVVCEDGRHRGRRGLRPETANEFVAPGLAQAAMDAAQGTWRSPTGRQVTFILTGALRQHVSAVARRKTRLVHQPTTVVGASYPHLVWDVYGRGVAGVVTSLAPYLGRDDLCVRLIWPDGSSQLLHPGSLPQTWPRVLARKRWRSWSVCAMSSRNRSAPALPALGLEQDPDVLDTWFSSGLWPMSTLGWPDPATAVVDPGQAPLGSRMGTRIVSHTTILARAW